MATTTPINALPAPDDSSPNDPPLHFIALNNQLDTRLVPRFATSTARDAAITAPVDGMVCTMTDTDRMLRYDGTKWCKTAGPREVLVANGNLGNSGAVLVGANATVSNGNLTVPIAAKTARVDFVAGIATVSGGQAALTLTVGGVTVSTQTVNVASTNIAVPVHLGADFDIASGTVAWVLNLAANSGSSANLSYSGIRVTI